MKASQNYCSAFIRYSLFIISCLFILSACNPLRKLPAGKYFLNRNIIHTDTVKLSKEEVASALKQKPNRKILGLFRLHLGLYYMGSAGDTTVEGHHFISKFWKKIKRGMREVGEAPVLIDSFLTAKSRLQLLMLLQNKGYFDARISDSIAPLNLTKGEALKVPLQGFELAKKANVVYYVKEGQPYKIRDVVYSSQDTGVAGILTAAKQNSLIKSGQRYDVDNLTQERDRITSEIRDSGMYFFSRNYITFDNDSFLNSHQVDVYLYVNRQYENVDASSGITHEPENHHRYNLNKIYVFTNYESGAAANPAPALDTTFFNGYYFVKDTGNDYIKKEALLRVLFIKSGDQYYKRHIDYTYSRLFDLGVFRFINFQYKEVPRDSLQTNYLLDVYIRLSPLEKYGYRTELEGTNSGGNLGVAGSVAFLNKNLFRSANTFELRLSGGLEKLPNFADNPQKYLVLFNSYNVGPEMTFGFKKLLFFRFLEKKFTRINAKTVLAAGINYQTRPDYTRLITRFSFGYQFPLSRKVYLSFYPLELNAVNVTLDPNFSNKLLATRDANLIYSYNNHLIQSMRLSLQMTNQTPHKEKNFYYFRYNIEWAGFFMKYVPITWYRNIYSQYLKPDIDLSYHQIFNAANTIVYHLTGGYGFTYNHSAGQLLPFDRAFFAGGANDIRAWLARTLGPGSYKNQLDIENSGDIKIEGNLEYRAAIIKVLETAAFIDAGNIWLRKDPTNALPGSVFHGNSFGNDIAIGAGVGLRFNFTFFIIRTDFAIKLKDPSLTPNTWVYNTSNPISRFNLSDIVPNLAIGYPF